MSRTFEGVRGPMLAERRSHIHGVRVQFGAMGRPFVLAGRRGR
jgi:hypothetical protein